MTVIDRIIHKIQKSDDHGLDIITLIRNNIYRHKLIKKTPEKLANRSV